MNETALITGCTSGIGLHLAHQFAKHFHPLVLVAPDQGELAELAAQLSSVYEIEVHIFACDLEQDHAVDTLVSQLHEKGISVDILVNNAGHGFKGKSWEVSQAQDLSMVKLNIEAPLRLTRAFLPAMLARQRGRILNTASIAGFEPGPLLNVYHSTKAFILSWSEALSVELEDTGVTVTALCPGPTDTDFFIKGGMENVLAFQKAQLMAPQEVAEAGYKGVMEGDMIVIPGTANKVLVAGRRVLTERAQARLNQQMYEDVLPEDRQRSRGDKENTYVSGE